MSEKPHTGSAAPTTRPFTLLCYDLRARWRSGAVVWHTLVFAFLGASLFPLALGTGIMADTAMAGGFVILLALFTTLFQLDRIFTGDMQKGFIDMISFTPLPLAQYAALRLGAHWLLSALPFIVASPLFALMLGLDPGLIWLMVADLILATLLLTWIGGLATVLALGAKNGRYLIHIIAIPLYVPVLIFAAGVMDLAAQGENPMAPLYFLMAMLAFAGPVIPLIIGRCLNWQRA